MYKGYASSHGVKCQYASYDILNVQIGSAYEFHSEFKVLVVLLKLLQIEVGMHNDDASCCLNCR